MREGVVESWARGVGDWVGGREGWTGTYVGRYGWMDVDDEWELGDDLQVGV